MKQNIKGSYRGSGICVEQQSFQNPLIKGDSYFDADLGRVVWNGKRWIQPIACRHRAGKMSEDGLQVCSNCGYGLVDFRNALAVGGIMHDGWPEGKFVYVTGSNPISFSRKPINPFESCEWTDKWECNM